MSWWNISSCLFSLEIKCDQTLQLSLGQFIELKLTNDLTQEMGEGISVNKQLTI